MKALILLLPFFLMGCGYSALNSEFTGQVKYVEETNPLICDSFFQSGVSLGVMKNGTGSVSTHDVRIYIATPELAELFKRAASSTVPVKITYRQRRLTWCIPEMEATKIEIAE